MNTKKCPKCKEEKNINEFYKSKQTKDGLKCWCKDCIKEDNRKREPIYNKKRREYRKHHVEEIRANKRKYYHKNKLIIDDQNKKWRQTMSGRFASYKHSANIRNIEFNLTTEEFNKYWQMPCYYCGNEIKTIGLDRINSNESYNVDNIVPCCSICNKMKLDLDKNIFKQQIEKIYKKQNG